MTGTTSINRVHEFHLSVAIHHLEQLASAWKREHGEDHVVNAIDNVANQAEALYEQLGEGQ